MSSVKSLREAANNWFFDVACSGRLFDSRRKLIDNIYKWTIGKNLSGTALCIEALADTFNTHFIEDHYDDIVDELRDAAIETFYELYEDGDLPDHYAKIVEDQL